MLLDTSVNAKGNDYLSIGFVMLEDSFPKFYLYRLPKMGVLKTGQAYVDMLNEALLLKTPGSTVLRTYILFFPNAWCQRQQMVISPCEDKIKSFRQLLSQNLFGDVDVEPSMDETVRVETQVSTLICIHCLAHKLVKYNTNLVVTLF